MTRVLAAASLAVLLAAQVRALTVDLDVKESAGAEATGHPVTVVVPLPEGAYQNPDAFVLAGPDGNPVAAQFSALNRWWVKDRSIRNLLVTFLADVKAGSSAKYALKDGGGPAAVDKPLAVEEGGELVTVTTGPLRFTVHKRACRIFEQVWLDLDGDGRFDDGERMLEEIPDQGAALTRAAGQAPLLASALAGAVVTLEEKGPVRAVIKVETPMLPKGNPYAFKLRIYAWKGRSDVQVDLTLKNDVLGPEGQILFFDDFSVKIKPAVSLAGAGLALGAASPLTGLLGAGASLNQETSGRFSATGSLTATGTHAEGWLDLADAARGMTVAVRDFRHLFPKGLESDAAGNVHVRLWPKWSQDTSDLYVLGDMQYRTHTVAFRFHKGGEPASAAADFARQVNARPAAVVPLSWYATTRQPHDLLGYLPVTEPIASPYFSGNPGDTLGWRNWWNNGRKYTPTTGGSFHSWKADRYMLSGNPRWLYWAEAWARQSADMRPIHLAGYVHPMSKSWPGFTAGGYGWRSWRNKFVEYPAGFKWDEWYPYDNQHAWISEMEEAYLYTGDRLLYDNLCNLGEIWKAELDKYRTQVPSGDYPHPRAMAWTLNAVRTQFTLSGDTSALSILVGAVGSFARTHQNGWMGCISARDHQAFMNAMLAVHVGSFHRELPPGRAKSEAFGLIMGIGDYLTTHSWAQDNRGIGRMDTERATPYYNNEEMGDVLPMLHLMTGFGSYRQKAKIISSNLGTWWTDWKGARPGRLMTYLERNPRADTVPPGPVTDLKAYFSEKRPDLVLLEWTVPQDAKRYDIRSSAKTLVESMASDETASRETWWHAEAHGDAPARAAGQRDWTVVMGSGIKDRNFMVRSLDNLDDAANLSAFSNIARAQCCFSPDTLPLKVLRGAGAARRPTLEAFRAGNGRWRILVGGIAACAGRSGCEVASLKLGLYRPDGRRVRDLASRLDGRLIADLEIGDLARGFYVLRLEIPGTVLEKRLTIGN